jgi:transcriptional regulator with XRE-family HTH domain
MANTVDLIASNIKRLRELKKLSQKEVATKAAIPQGQYSRIENAKVEPSVTTLEKLAKVFEVSVTEFFKTNGLQDDINLPMLEKIKLVDALGKKEQQAIFTMIDMAIANKKLKDNLTQLIAS